MTKNFPAPNVTDHHSECLDAPEEVSVSASLVTLAEGATFTPVFCSAAAVPEPEVAWRRRGESGVISSENTLDFR